MVSPMITLPAVCFYVLPVRILRKVDFPVPFFPMIPMRSPSLKIVVKLIQDITRSLKLLAHFVQLNHLVAHALHIELQLNFMIVAVVYLRAP